MRRLLSAVLLTSTMLPQSAVLAQDATSEAAKLMEVFVRRDGQWWIEAYHNVDVKPSSPESGP